MWHRNEIPDVGMGNGQFVRCLCLVQTDEDTPLQYMILSYRKESGLFVTGASSYLRRHIRSWCYLHDVLIVIGDGIDMGEK